MASWGPVDIDCDKISDEDVKWDDDVMKDLESRFEELRQHNRKFNESRDEATREDASIVIEVQDMISKNWLQMKCMIN